jgi:hypothetical protein
VGLHAYERSYDLRERKSWTRVLSAIATFSRAITAVYMLINRTYKEIKMNAKWYSIVLLGAILLVISACGGGAATQEVLPTLAVNPTSEADVQQLDTPTPEVLTFDENQGVEGTPTMNLPAIAETSEAISVPLQQALRQVTGIQNLISVSAIGNQTGIAVSIEAEIAEADNNETTMAAILAAVQAQSSAVTVINVGTWVGEVQQRRWVWQNGTWTSS